jgi:hypothetical protein
MLLVVMRTNSLLVLATVTVEVAVMGSLLVTVIT